MIHRSIVKLFLDIEVKVVFVRADGSHELCDIIGVQSAGLCRQTAGQVCVANMGHTLQNKKQLLLKLYNYMVKKESMWKCNSIYTQTLYTDNSPGTVVSMLPPASAAKSTTTEPSFMLSIIGVVIKMGARLPRI